MFQGIRTVIYAVSDADKAKEWYSAVLGFGPYFDQPYYIGYNVGGYELGLDPNGEIASNKPANVRAYWGVADCEAAFQRLMSLGAKEHSPVSDVGEGIKVASVFDPFGNLFGIIENPHFK